MTILKNIRELASGKSGLPQEQVIRVPRAAVAWRGGAIAWVGPEREIPAEYAGDEVYDAGGGIVVPGLIDCHTHLAFAGWRTRDFESRISGKTYREIAQAGGGILTTVEHTRNASRAELVERCRGFARQMTELGITTIEAKSGYGLNVPDELKILEVYRELNERGPLTIVPTLLAAHAVPPEYHGSREAYVRLIIDDIIPQAASRGLARFCDVFIDQSAFSIDEARRILSTAKNLGLGAKLHADQLEDGRGAELAGELRAVSADHIEHISQDGIDSLARNGVIAVLLPLASLYTNQPAAPARRLLRAKVPVAISTDFNPGTAPSYHLPLAMTLGCTMNGLTPAEALNAVTSMAAEALGIGRDTGTIEVGKNADLIVLDAESIEHWCYHFRGNACVMTIKNGAKLY